MRSSQLRGRNIGLHCITCIVRASATIAMTPGTHLERSFEDFTSKSSPVFFILLWLLSSSFKFPPRVVGLVAEPPYLFCANLVSSQPNSFFKEAHSLVSQNETTSGLQFLSDAGCSKVKPTGFGFFRAF